MKGRSETAVYVYGVVAAPGPPPGTLGLADAKVELVEHGELAALTSAVPSGPLRAKRRDLLKHTEVLQDAYAAGTVLPLRFGTVFRGASSVVDDFIGPR